MLRIANFERNKDIISRSVLISGLPTRQAQPSQHVTSVSLNIDEFHPRGARSSHRLSLSTLPGHLKRMSKSTKPTQSQVNKRVATRNAEEARKLKSSLACEVIVHKVLGADEAKARVLRLMLEASKRGEQVNKTVATLNAEEQ